MPEPMAPRKSAITDNPPIHSPPKAAAVGMYLEHKTGRLILIHRIYIRSVSAEMLSYKNVKYSKTLTMTVKKRRVRLEVLHVLFDKHFMMRIKLLRVTLLKLSHEEIQVMVKYDANKLRFKYELFSCW